MVSRYLAADWGSTNLRLWLVQDGVVLKRAGSPFGITRMQDRSFAEVLHALMREMQVLPEDITQLYIAGMAGSNLGWKEAAYLPCPVPLNALSGSLTPVDPGWPARAGIIPGVCVAGPEGADVMRGEETQILGAVQASRSALLVLPGTHCKWAQVQDNVIRGFSTVMTGELFDVLRHHSLLGRGVPAGAFQAGAFEAGVAAGLAATDTLTELFTVRAKFILRHLAAEAVDDYLSGLLIGGEVRDMRLRFDAAPGAEVTLVGSGTLFTRYEKALRQAGLLPVGVDAETAILNGIRKIHDALDT